MRRSKALLSLVGLALAGVSAPLGAQTNGFVLQCMSARTAGQGCVTRAQSANPTTLFRDPAGLVDFDRPALEVNLSPFAPTLTFDNGANAGVDGARHLYPMLSAAYVGPRLGGGRVAWGVGIEPIGGFGADFDLRHDLLSGPDGDPLRYQSYFAALKAGPAVAVELAPGLSVGASVSVLYEQIRDFRMPFTMPPSVAPGMAAIPQLDPAVYGPLFQQFTELTAYGDSEGYAGFGWAADLGVRYAAASGFTVAASWSPERPVVVDGGTAVIDMGAQFAQVMEAMVAARAQAYGESPAAAQQVVVAQLTAAGLDLGAGMTAVYRAETEITLPMTAGLGVSVPVREELVVGAEVEWRRWSTAEESMPFRLTAGDNPNINLMMSGDPTAGDFTYPFPLEWDDTWSAKVGASWTFDSGNALRAGFLHGANPVPTHTVFVTFPAISTTAVTAGTTWSLGGFPVDVSFVHAFEKELLGCDLNHKLGAEYARSRTTMSQNVFTLGTRVGF